MLLAENLKRRTINVLFVGIYFFCFIVGYHQLVHPIYDYYGMGWSDLDGWTMGVIWMMNLSLAFAMPPCYKRPSHLFLAVQFLIVFLPATIVCLNASLPMLPADQVWPMLIAMYLGLWIQTAGAYASGRLWKRPRLETTINPKSFLCIFMLISAIILVSAMYALRDIFQFSSLEALYSQRELLGDVSLGTFLQYGLAWQSMVILPAVFTAGLMLQGRYRLIALAVGVIGYALLFGLTATKTTLLAPFIIASIFFLLKDRPQPFVGLLALGLAGLICIPFLMKWLDTAEIIPYWYVGIVNFRILSVPQLLYTQYLDFFSQYPLTYGSHIKFVDTFIKYPYDGEVSMIIGDYYYPGSKMNANAGMWAQDGLAGFGVPGIIVISCVFSTLMIVLDVAARRHNARWVGTSLAMITLFISNASLFTTVLTGGLGLVILFLFASRPIAWPAMTLQRTARK